MAEVHAAELCTKDAQTDTVWHLHAMQAPGDGDEPLHLAGWADNMAGMAWTESQGLGLIP